MPAQAHASKKILQTAARVALLGLLINVVLASVKIVAGVIGHAYVLIADGIESALDIGGSIVIWGGLTVAARPPDETHPYGHGKAEPIAAIAVALGVLAAATGLAIESVREILTPHHGPAPFTLAILIVVIVVKEILFRYVNRLGRQAESTAVQTDAWHHRSDALTSTAAFVGISAALLGGEAWYSADDWAALFACAVIAANGVRLLRCRRSMKSWTRRLVEKLSDPFAPSPAQFPVLSRWKNVMPVRWAWIITSIFTSALMATFPCTKATRSRIE